jgi:hypothetical protein
MIDWKKPVELMNGTSVEVLKVYEADDIVVLSWVGEHGYRCCSWQLISCSSNLRNIRTESREWWLSPLICREYGSPSEDPTYVHVREVLEDK